MADNVMLHVVKCANNFYRLRCSASKRHVKRCHIKPTYYVNKIRIFVLRQYRNYHDLKIKIADYYVKYEHYAIRQI